MESNEFYSNSDKNSAEINSIKESIKLGINSNNQKNDIVNNKLGDDEQIKFFNKEPIKKNKKLLTTPNIIPYVKNSISSKHIIRHKNTIFEKVASQTNKTKKQQSNFKEILYNYVKSTKQIPIRNFEYVIEGEPVKLKYEKEDDDVFTLKNYSEEEIEKSSSSSDSSSDSESENNKSNSLDMKSNQTISELNENKKISENNKKHVTINCDNNYYYEFNKNNFDILKNFCKNDKDAYYINDNAKSKRPSAFSNFSYTGTTKANTRYSYTSSAQSIQTNNNNNNIQKFIVNKTSKSNLTSNITVTKNNKNINNTINALNLIKKLKNLNISLANEKNNGKYLNNLNVKANSIKKYVQSKINMKLDRKTNAFVYANISAMSQKKDLHSKTHISSFFAKLKHKKSM